VSWLARFEQSCAAFIERAFARSFPSDLAPAQVARKLIAIMEAQTRSEDGRLVAPGDYTVYVHPEELERLEPDRAYLEREWAELLRDLAVRVGAAFLTGGPHVAMAAASSVPPGAVEIETSNERRSFHLRTVKGVPADALYPVDGELRIGRGKDMDVDPSVSRHHATVALIEGVLTVRDLGSTNGTFVNEERVQQRQLQVGDTLTFGNTKMRVEAEG